MRKFIFTWYKKETNPVERKNTVTVSKDFSDIATAAKLATELFVKDFGNLKKNEIVNIQEIDKDGAFIGEPIVPEVDSAIVPTGR